MYNYSLETNSTVIAASIIALCAGSAYVMYNKIKSSDIDFSVLSEIFKGLKDASSDSCELSDSNQIETNDNDGNDNKIDAVTQKHAAKKITSIFRDNLNKRQQQEPTDKLDGSVVVVSNN